MVIPMKGQFEQQCNAAALKTLGVPVLKNLKTKHIRKVQDWLKDNSIVDLDFPDETDSVINLLIQKHAGEKEAIKIKQHRVETGGKFRELVLKKIFKQIET